jgi:hypothetical protein
MEKRRGAHKVLVGKPEGRRPLGRLKFTTHSVQKPQNQKKKKKQKTKTKLVFIQNDLLHF